MFRIFNKTFYVDLRFLILEFTQQYIDRNEVNYLATNFDPCGIVSHIWNFYLPLWLRIQISKMRSSFFVKQLLHSRNICKMKIGSNISITFLAQSLCHSDINVAVILHSISVIMFMFFMFIYIQDFNDAFALVMRRSHNLIYE